MRRLSERNKRHDPDSDGCPRRRELDTVAEDRIEPVAGETLQVSLDYNIQAYCQQAAENVLEEKQAEAVSILLMDPRNGEIYAMVNVPEFDLNDPYELNTGVDAASLSDEELQEQLNQMWRNRCINDTYEPGSTFKIITASACLEEGVVSLGRYLCMSGIPYSGGQKDPLS